MEPSLNEQRPHLSLPWRKGRAPAGPAASAPMCCSKVVLALLLSLARPAGAEPWERRPVPVPSLAEVAQAYRRHVAASNAETVEALGARKAQPYLVRIVDLEAVRCEYHSGRSHLCRIVVSVAVDGRVGPRRAGDALMTPDEDGGWKLRRPR